MVSRHSAQPCGLLGPCGQGFAAQDTAAIREQSSSQSTVILRGLGALRGSLPPSPR